MSQREQFDPSRASLRHEDQFQPFAAGHTIPLHRALGENKIKKHTPLLVNSHDEVLIALSMEQMAYHHVAQGEIGGNPWMVSF